ncbi:hypothetical protein M569_02577 [Genlisea aurea]|uniref:Uncharacterized protein n=1 Tax=Genlisea aurea TaxID=192259 RepID=S8D463_9LAMI|nr:hypothetical protein M569_02577 [Genlisea aurea]
MALLKDIYGEGGDSNSLPTHSVKGSNQSHREGVAACAGMMREMDFIRALSPCLD